MSKATDVALPRNKVTANKLDEEQQKDETAIVKKLNATGKTGEPIVPLQTFANLETSSQRPAATNEHDHLLVSTNKAGRTEEVQSEELCGEVEGESGNLLLLTDVQDSQDDELRSVGSSPISTQCN